MLIGVLKQIWQSALGKGTRSPSLTSETPPLTEEDQSALRKHLLESPQDMVAWYRLGRLEAISRPDPPDVMNRPDREFWFAIAAAGLAHKVGERGCALEFYHRALAMDTPYSAQVLANMGVVFKELVLISDAIRCFEESLALQSGLAEVHYNLGLTLYEMGRSDEAEHHLRRSLELKPEFAPAQSTLLCVLAFCRHHDKERIYAEHVTWAERHANHLTRSAPHQLHEPLAERRPLRIGYVSADFREHSVSFFIEPIFRHHDREIVQIFCYDNWPGQDPINQRLQALADKWRKIHDLDDEQAAALIRADDIDILVDLSGHTAGNRLLMFARKPAPIQASWFGYMCTTGLAAMDYRITDSYLDPPGMTEQFYTEKLIRLGCCVAFSPAPDAPEVNSAPSKSNGYITFGSFNNYTKIGEETIAVWAQILASVPQSRLLVVAMGGDEPEFQEQVIARFTAHGAPSGSIEVMGKRPLSSFLRMFHAIDIALDPFPYSGGTTSLHTLWMGVPIVALEGESELSRSTSGMLRGAGLDQLVATTPAQYHDIARRLAGEIDLLTSLRSQMRTRISSSGIFNSREVTRDLESAYVQMWQNWCTEEALARTKLVS